MILMPAHSSSRLMRFALSAFVLAACRPDKVQENESTNGMAETGATSLMTSPTSDGGSEECDDVHSGTDDCCCFSSAVFQDTHDIQISNACSSKELCPRVGLHCSPYDLDCPSNYGPDSIGGGEDYFSADDESALDCILIALRDGTPGKVSWGVNEESEVQYSSTSHIRKDRVVFIYRKDRDDLNVVYSDVTQEKLLAPEVFADCVDATDLRNKFKCLATITTGSVIKVCAPGGQVESL